MQINGVDKHEVGTEDSDELSISSKALPCGIEPLPISIKRLSRQWRMGEVVGHLSHSEVLNDRRVSVNSRLRNVLVDGMDVWQKNRWRMILKNLARRVFVDDDLCRQLLWLILRKGHPLILERLDNLVATLQSLCLLPSINRSFISLQRSKNAPMQFSLDLLTDASTGARLLLAEADDRKVIMLDSLPLVWVTLATLIVVAIWLLSLHYSWIVI
jgi:hypothetical protein